MNQAKPWYLSKTLWINVLGAIILLIPAVSDYIDPKTGALVLAVANVALRLITSKGLVIK